MIPPPCWFRAPGKNHNLRILLSSLRVFQGRLGYKKALVPVIHDTKAERKLTFETVLAFGELEALTGSGKAILLPLFLTGIAREEAY